MKSFLSFIKEGAEEHETVKDHIKNPYHKTLTDHGFQHHSTTHKQNRFAKDNPKADYTEHHYTHPSHGKSHVTVTQEHGKGVYGKDHSFIHRHEQSNGIMAPSHGENKNQLHRSLSSAHGVPKGVEAPKLTASEKKYPHTAPKYKMHESSDMPDHTSNPFHKTLTKHGFTHTNSNKGVSIHSNVEHHNYTHPEKGKVNVTVAPKGHGFAETHWRHAHETAKGMSHAARSSSAGKTHSALDTYLSHPNPKGEKLRGVHHVNY